MYCEKYSATISVKVCIQRQELAISKNPDYINFTFSKCSKCKLGKKIKKNPHPLLDCDIRRLLREYLPKPKKYKLNNNGKYPKIKRYELKCWKK